MSERDQRNSNRDSRNRGSGNNRSRSGGSYKGNPRGGGDRYKGRGQGNSRQSGSRGRRPPYLQKGIKVFILDVLQHGGIDTPGHSWNPICQIIEVPKFKLHEIEINKGKTAQIQDMVVIQGEGGVLGRVHKQLKYDDLTRTSQELLKPTLEGYIKDHESFYIGFINNAEPITIKRHSLEVLPGVGKKLMWEIVNNRQRQPFTDFEDLHTKVPGFKPVEVIAKRIIEELSSEDEKHYLFIRRSRPRPSQDRSRARPPQRRY